MTLFYPHYSRNENATKIRQNLEKNMWTGALLTLLDRHETIRNQWKTAAIMVIVWLARRINPTWSSGEASEFGKKNGHDSKWVSPKSKRCHTNIYIYCERVILFDPGPFLPKKIKKGCALVKHNQHLRFNGFAWGDAPDPFLDQSSQSGLFVPTIYPENFACLAGCSIMCPSKPLKN